MTRLLALLFAGVAVAAVPGYQAEIAEWRKRREDRLKAEGGWLSLAGLFWLHDGANRFGKDQANDIVLPDGPAHAGIFELARRKGDGHAGRKDPPGRAGFRRCRQGRTAEPVRHQARRQNRHPR